MKEPSDDTGKIARSAGIVSVAVMCSRALGLVREQVFAAMFGAGFAYDSFVVAFRIPNLLRDLFGEGALSAAFVSVFSEYDANKGSKATWQLASNVLLCMAMLLSLLTIAGMFFSEEIVRFIVRSDFENIPGKVTLTTKMTVIMFPFLIMVSLSSVVMGILNTKGHFFLPAMASSFFNLGSIIGGVILAFVLPHYGQPAIIGMAIGTLIGGMLQFVGQFPALRKIHFTFRPQFDLADPGLRRIFRLMIPALVGLAPLQINIFVNTYFASSLPEGSLSWLNYAFRLFWFPVGIFGVALSVASLPVMARHAALKDMEKLGDALASSLCMVFCLALPASVGLILLAGPILKVIFEYGQFDAYTTSKTAEALICYAVGLFGYSAVKVIVPVFYALDETRYPVIGSFLVTGFNIFFIFLTLDWLGHQALALSISLAMTLNFLFLIMMLYRKINGFSLGYLIACFGKVLMASLAMGAWIFSLQPLVLPGAGSVFSEIIRLLLLIGSSALLYLGLLYLLRLKEARMLTTLVWQRWIGLRKNQI